MDLKEASSETELKEFFSNFGSNTLFRGQTRLYQDEAGRISIPTSFHRKGCIPPLMIKWSHYAAEILRTFSGQHNHDFPLGVAQALLQHYGWRSFFIDLTISSQIASWFAANEFHADVCADLVEDCFEDPLFLRSEVASYKIASEDGYVFAVDCDMLSCRGIEQFNLEELIPTEFETRFSAQKAVLIGPTELLPAECVVAAIKAPTHILTSYAESLGPMTSAQLFPPRESDGFLEALLSVPFERLGASTGVIDAFGRGLALPEYDYRFVKHNPPQTAFYAPAWITHDFDFERSPAEVCRVDVPDAALFGSGTATDDNLGAIFSMMGDASILIIETSGLLRHIETGDGMTYGKGVVLHRNTEGTFCLSELVVEHPGLRLAGVGAEMGWSYQRIGTRLVRLEEPDDCPCNNPYKHQRHLVLLRIVNALAVDGELELQDERRYVHRMTR